MSPYTSPTLKKLLRYHNSVLEAGHCSFGKWKVSVISFVFSICDDTWNKLYFGTILYSLYISSVNLFSFMSIWKTCIHMYSNTCITNTHISISTHPALWIAFFLLHSSLIAISKCLCGFVLIQFFFNRFKYSTYHMYVSLCRRLKPFEFCFLWSTLVEIFYKSSLCLNT